MTFYHTTYLSKIKYLYFQISFVAMSILICFVIIYHLYMCA